MRTFGFNLSLLGLLGVAGAIGWVSRAAARMRLAVGGTMAIDSMADSVSRQNTTVNE